MPGPHTAPQNFYSGTKSVDLIHIKRTIACAGTGIQHHLAVGAGIAAPVAKLTVA